MTTTPPRSIQQRRDALERANDVRLKRAKLKRDLRAGRIRASYIIANPPEWLETMKVMDLLMAVPRIGRVKVSKALKVVQISHAKTVGGLSHRQRQELVWWLE